MGDAYLGEWSTNLLTNLANVAIGVELLSYCAARGDYRGILNMLLARLYAIRTFNHAYLGVGILCLASGLSSLLNRALVRHCSYLESNGSECSGASGLACAGAGVCAEHDCEGDGVDVLRLNL